MLFLYDDGGPLVEADVFLNSCGTGKDEGDVERGGGGSANVVLGCLGIARSI